MSEAVSNIADIGKRVPRAKLGLSEAEYNAHWVRRIKSRVKVSATGCWIWAGTKNGKGYGLAGYRTWSTSIHRTMYKIIHGVTLTTQQFVCHRCDTPPCCNPDHLFLGNNDINTADRTAKRRHHELRVTHCPRGHAYDEKNTYIWKGNNSRHCKICARIKCRLASGWPEHLAVSVDKVPSGYRFLEGRMPKRAAHE